MGRLAPQISSTSIDTWNRWVTTSRVSIWNPGRLPRCQVDTLFIYDSSHFYTLSLEFNLCRSPDLRFLQFDLNLEDEDIRKSQDNERRDFAPAINRKARWGLNRRTNSTKQMFYILFDATHPRISAFLNHRYIHHHSYSQKYCKLTRYQHELNNLW